MRATDPKVQRPPCAQTTERRDAPWPQVGRQAALFVILTGLAVTATACPSVDNPYTPLPVADFSVFVTKIQPVIGHSCAFAACHGKLGSSLTLYAVDYLRAPPAFSDTPLDEKHLTDAELSWNYEALCMRLRNETSAANSALLLKCLDPKQGGIVHADGLIVFPDRSQPAYKALEGWISGGLK